MEFERTRVRRREVGLIALIDVAMFLLIFFLVAGTIEKFDIIPVTPPKAESGKLVDEGHLVILLGTHDEIVAEDELVSIDRMADIVRERISGNPNKVITLKADANIPAVRMIEVMDRIKQSGGKNLSIATHSQGKQ